MEPYFDHERLEVYAAARRLNREVHELVRELPSGQAESIDNLVRAAKSVGRNISEGSGRWSIADKMRFYHIARASATESAASLDELVDYGVVSEERIRKPKHTAARIVSMLIRMIRSIEGRGKNMGDHRHPQTPDETPSSKSRVRVPVRVRSP